MLRLGVPRRGSYFPSLGGALLQLVWIPSGSLGLLCLWAWPGTSPSALGLLPLVRFGFGLSPPGIGHELGWL